MRQIQKLSRIQYLHCSADLQVAIISGPKASDLHLVDSVVFLVGTNDLRFFRDHYGNPGDLRAFIQPIEKLISLSSQCFGHDVKINFHSVLSMHCLYTYTAANFEGFNRLLRDICTFNGCFYVDWFNMFLNCQGSDFDLSLQWDKLHLSRQSCNILHNLLNDLLWWYLSSSTSISFSSNTIHSLSIFQNLLNVLQALNCPLAYKIVLFVRQKGYLFVQLYIMADCDVFIMSLS